MTICYVARRSLTMHLHRKIEVSSTEELSVDEAQPRRSLAAIWLLEGLGEAERKSLEQQCRWRRYRLGERVFERGSTGDEVFFVVEGAVNIVSLSPTNHEVTFATSDMGDIVGELAAIDEQPRSASVVASEESLLAVVPASVFVALLKQHAEITFRLLQRLSGLLRGGNERVLEVGSLEATNRIYNELLRAARPDDAVPDLWVIKPMPPLRELASLSSATRELVAGALNRLYPSGIIRRKGDSLYIMDRPALEEIVRVACMHHPD